MRTLDLAKDSPVASVSVYRYPVPGTRVQCTVYTDIQLYSTVVQYTQYGQFQPIDAGETDQERRKRRNNTFAKQPTEYIQEIGSKGQLLRIIRHRVKE